MVTTSNGRFHSSEDAPAAPPAAPTVPASHAKEPWYVSVGQLTSSMLISAAAIIVIVLALVILPILQDTSQSNTKDRDEEAKRSKMFEDSLKRRTVLEATQLDLNEQNVVKVREIRRELNKLEERLEKLAKKVN